MLLVGAICALNAKHPASEFQTAATTLVLIWLAALVISLFDATDAVLQHFGTASLQKFWLRVVIGLITSVILGWLVFQVLLPFVMKLFFSVIVLMGK
jgi:hypothetical protein